jgi:flagellar motor switch protein FliM
MSDASPPPVTLLRGHATIDDFAVLAPHSDRLARAFQDMFTRRASGLIEAKPGTIQAARYTEWRISQNPFGMLLRYHVPSNGTELIVHIPGHLVGQIIDIHYGGTGQVPVRQTFTPAETKFVERLGRQLVPHVGLVAGVQAELVELQPDILSFSWPKSLDAICLVSIFVENPAIKSATISCFMAVETARSLASRIAGSSEQSRADDPVWQSKMQSAAMRVRFPARAILTRCEMPATRLLCLAPGDILPVILPSKVPLTIAGRHFAYGTIGEANGRAALQIETIEGMDQ